MERKILICLIYILHSVHGFAFKPFVADNPIEVIMQFINDLGKKDYKSAYAKTDGKIWGTYESFSSEQAFGCIYSTTIHGIIRKQDEVGRAVVQVDATYLSTAGNNRYLENFYLQKIGESWKIVKLKVIKITNLDDENYFIDERDQHRYRTVKIGAQTWMAENLAYNIKNEGCWAYNDDQSNVSKYGYLYNWDVAVKISPPGWHLPSEEECMILFEYLGGENIAGIKMKSATGWDYYANINISNDSGFNAFPAGVRGWQLGDYSDIGKSCAFWTDKEQDGYGWHFSLIYNTNEVSKGFYHPNQGLSVRLIKD